MAVVSCGGAVAKQSALKGPLDLLQICMGGLQLLQVPLQTLNSGLR